MKSNGCFVGFDTSNYTTSISVADFDGRIVANLKKLLPVEDGACGLRQSDAVFAHVRNLPVLTEELRGYIDGRRVLAVGVSSKPKNIADSYMPCFLSGVAAAESFAVASGVELFGFSHQSGHVRAAVYSSGQQNYLLGREFIAFHVSGGTTDMLSVKPCKAGFDITTIGNSLDINAGQAVDRAGVMMGMKFPCGPELERVALTYAGKVPKPGISVKGLNCNLSGLQNLAEKLWRETGDKSCVGRYVLEFIGKTLKTMTNNAESEFGKMPIVYAGGVMSNSIIREILSDRDDVFFAEPAYSADNAAGIALLCRDKYLSNSRE